MLNPTAALFSPATKLCKEIGHYKDTKSRNYLNTVLWRVAVLNLLVTHFLRLLLFLSTRSQIL
jgi:hypothetical protein